MNEAAKQARRDYMRQWRTANPEKNAEYQRRYWEKKIINDNIKSVIDRVSIANDN